jgi:hypothetical protein
MDANVIQTVNDMMQQVRTAADDARQAATANNEVTALERCSAAVALATRAVNAIQVAAVDDHKDEWKECRATIGRFDTILVDLRKVGFSFVTAIVSGATFFFVQDPTKHVSESAKFATFSFILVLVLVLYVVDRIHQVWLQDAVTRAQTLENLFGYELTKSLSKSVSQTQAIGVGIVIYLVLIAITYVAFSVSIEAPIIAFAGYQGLMWIEFIVGIIVIEVLIYWPPKV